MLSDHWAQCATQPSLVDPWDGGSGAARPTNRGCVAENARAAAAAAAQAAEAAMNQQCKVCGEPAAGFHFGAFTCEGCK
ncbi:Uncharacterized protein GBIM_02795, partial [Gryllus bimaculatus]